MEMESPSKKMSVVKPSLKHYKGRIIFVLITCITFLYYYTIVATHERTFDYKVPRNSYIIETNKCRILNLDPLDKTVKYYIKKVPNIVCDKKEPLTKVNKTSIWIDDNVAKQYTDLKCCYEAFDRKAPVANVSSDFDVKFEKCINFENETKIAEDFIRVTCTNKSEEVYRNFYIFAHPKVKKKENTPKGPSVLILGVDSVSRLNLLRQLPRTVSTLASFKSIELYGYNKIDDNTFPNLMGVLAGKSWEELSHTCWFKNQVFDPCTFIWNNYSDAGYHTAYGEDMVAFGTFQYNGRKGFSKPPVDYYLRPFMDRIENEIGLPKAYLTKTCVGNRATTKVLYNYAVDLAIELAKINEKYFGFFWGSTLVHNDVNIPPDLDDIQVDIFNKLNKTVLNNTIVVFMSDHGIRFGGIRETYQGHLEERLPFVHFIFPDWFKTKYSSAVANLQRNSFQLTSPFDLHATLMDLSNTQVLEETILANRSHDIKPERGLSMFLPIPDRTCEEAGIPEFWCSCTESVAVPLDDHIVMQAAETIVKEINYKLYNQSHCASLSLARVISAQQRIPNESFANKAKSQSYVLVISTVPNYAKYEATVGLIKAKEKFQIESYISRINEYGNQSDCVEDAQLKLYCYCV